MRTDQAIEQNMKRPMPICTRRRGSKRSASAPARVENNRNGNQWEMTANPPRAGEWNFWNAVQ